MPLVRIVSTNNNNNNVLLVEKRVNLQPFPVTSHIQHYNACLMCFGQFFPFLLLEPRQFSFLS